MIYKFIDDRFGDLVGILLIVGGSLLVAFGADETTKDLGKSLAAAGLLAMKLRSNNVKSTVP